MPRIDCFRTDRTFGVVERMLRGIGQVLFQITPLTGAVLPGALVALCLVAVTNADFRTGAVPGPPMVA